jgi:hypothetical protein
MNTDLRKFGVNKAVQKYVLKKLQFLPNIENINWSEEKLISNEVLNKINQKLEENKIKFESLKIILSQNDQKTDLRNLSIEKDSERNFFIYVLKSLERSEKISNIDWPKNYEKALTSNMDLFDDIKQKLNENKVKHVAPPISGYAQRSSIITQRPPSPRNTSSGRSVTGWPGAGSSTKRCSSMMVAIFSCQ